MPSIVPESVAMTWFADGAPCSYFTQWKVKVLVAAGWLEVGHTFARGELPPSDRALVHTMLALPRHFPGLLFMGPHTCSLCPGSPSGPKDIPTGYYNIYVPDGNQLWVAPELIAHYVDVHGYAPPEPFLEAAERALAMPPADYTRACHAIWDSAPLPTGFEHRLVELDADNRPRTVLFLGRDTPLSRPAPQKHVLLATPKGDVFVEYGDIPGHVSVGSPFPSPCSLNAKPLDFCRSLTDGDILELDGRRYRYEASPFWETEPSATPAR